MASNGLTANDWENWLTPRAAVAKICDAIGGEIASRHAILDRLIGSQIHAIARTATVDGGTAPQGNYSILPQVWIRIENAFTIHANWWKTGDISVEITTNASFSTYQKTTIRLFGVRLNPQDVDRMLGDLGVKTETTKAIDYPNATRPKIAATGPKKNISQDHLAAWWTFYQAVAGPNLETEEYALSHFERCFPEYKIPREEIRKLRRMRPGGLKPGPKPKPAE